jgi:hypothetical protein
MEDVYSKKSHSYNPLRFIKDARIPEEFLGKITRR